MSAGEFYVLTPEDADRLALYGRELGAGDEHDADAAPFALRLDAFIAARSEAPAALVGDETENLLPATGLLMLFAKGGKGKTTLTVEAALHLASGIDWLGFTVARPLNVLFIENEGPREPFRAKLEHKLASWPHELRGAVHVHVRDWGAFTLADSDLATELREYVTAHAIDVVIADPLDSLGVEGVGSPEDTRNFVALMSSAGLFRDCAFWLLHHPRKEGAQDELDEVSGAWGGKPDSMLRLDKLDGDRARLSFPKVRWTRRGTRPALVLDFDAETESYTVVHEEPDEERNYFAETKTLLAVRPWLTTKEIAAPKPGGIGANEKTVKKLLNDNPDTFTSRTGEDAKEVGRSATATVWGLSQAIDSVDSVTSLADKENRTDLTDFPLRGSQVELSPSPPDQPTEPAFESVNADGFPLPGDDNFLHHVVKAHRAGHLTNGEALQRRQLHLLILRANAVTGTTTDPATVATPKPTETTSATATTSGTDENPPTPPPAVPSRTPTRGSRG